MRRRLALLVAATTALVLNAFVVPLALLIRNVAADRAINSATAEAQSLAPLVAAMDLASLRLVVEQLDAGQPHHVTVFLPDGTLIGASLARTPAVELATRGRSFSVATAQGTEIVVAVAGLPAGTAVIRTFVSRAELYRGVAQAWLVLGLLGAALLAFGVVVADALARRLVRQIRELAATSRLLATGDLHARARPDGPPEVQEVAAALNHLAGHIRDLIRQEREAAADMSHRLRTPLTALRLEADSSGGVVTADRVKEHVTGLERAITELITHTRRGESEPGPCDATKVVAERIAFWAVLAEDQDRTLRTHLPSHPLPVRLPAADLAASLDALLGNVFAYTPDGTPFAVSVATRRGGGAIVTVEDAGPGFSTDPLETGPLERGESPSGSTGLGLDIARHTAETSGGRLSAARSTALGGARIVLELGPPPQNPGHSAGGSSS